MRRYESRGRAPPAAAPPAVAPLLLLPLLGVRDGCRTACAVALGCNQEREWLSTVRGLLHDLRHITTEVSTALRELDELGSAGWRPASETLGLRTEWRPHEDGSLWVRIDGELSGADLLHAAAVAHEADLWPKWMPFCGGAEIVSHHSPYERY